MDSGQKGAVAWPDFAKFYSCKLIAAKNKVKMNEFCFYLTNNYLFIFLLFYLIIYFKTLLTTKLSKKELIFAKNLFLNDPPLKVDKDNNIIITKSYFNRVYHDLVLLIKYSFFLCKKEISIEYF